MPLDLKDIIDNYNIVFDNLMIDGFIYINDDIVIVVFFSFPSY